MSFPYGRTRRVDGGIKARSTRGAIGESWWSKRFLAVLESFALGTRLTRGRSYARAGQVLSLAVEPGSVTADVQGSRPKPYRVAIRLAVFPDDVWARVEESVAGQAIHAARLLAGELPAEIEEVCAAAGAPLFPKRLRDLALSCSCPDSAVPCKHLAATFYLLAEAFDADPFQILRWRGRDRATLLAHLGEASSAVEPARLPDTAETLGELPAPADVLSRFWLPPVPLPLPTSTFATEPDLLLRQLPTPPAVLGGLSLTARLRAYYESLGRRS